jgi:hypothetical protein
MPWPPVRRETHVYRHFIFLGRHGAGGFDFSLGVDTSG